MAARGRASMRRILWLPVALGAICAPAPALGRDFEAPALKAPRESPDPEFRLHPQDDDLHELILHLQSAVSSKDVPPKNIPGIDFFIARLEEALLGGSDVPRDNILRNADAAREELRLAFNDLAAAGSPPALPRARDTLKEVSRALSALLERNRESLDLLRSVGDSAMATASAMTVKPPGSPGRLVPVELLCGIVSLKPELKVLQGKLKEAGKALAEAKSLIKQAKGRAQDLQVLARRAAELDEDAAEHARQRRTSGRPDPSRAPLQSRDVILNGHDALERAVKKAEAAAAALETQLDPAREGLRLAVDKALVADAMTQNAKAIEVKSGVRINYNHAVRLNNLIRDGWKAAPPEREPWWVGRAGMARREASADGAKMDFEQARAQYGAEAAERLLQAGLAAVDGIDRLLGASGARYARIAQSFSDAPAPTVPAEPTAPRPTRKSQPLRTPKVFSATGGAVPRAFDNGHE